MSFKLSTLRQQIWTGVNFESTNKDRNGISYPRSPLSWGISNMAHRGYQTDSEALLKYS